MSGTSRKSIVIGSAIVALAGYLLAAESSKKEARVTRIIREVNLLPGEAKPRPATLNDQVREGTAVRTGDESKSELTFLDLTITRLGENTIFTFNKAGRSVDLTSGSILLRVPKDSGGATIRTSGVTAGIAGTTVILEAPGSGQNKLMVLEGRARLSLRKYAGQSKEVRAGQMLDVPAGARSLPDPVAIDLQQVMRSHPLIKDFPPLPSEPLITQEIQNQNPRYVTVPQRPASSLGGLRVPPSSLPPSRPPSRPPPPPTQSGTGTGDSTTVPPPTPGGSGGGKLPPSRPPAPGAPTTGGASGGTTTVPPGRRPRPGGPITGVGTVGTVQSTPTQPPVILKGSPTPVPGGTPPKFQPPFYNAVGPAAGSAQTQASPTPSSGSKPFRGRSSRKRPTPPPIR